MIKKLYHFIKSKDLLKQLLNTLIAFQLAIQPVLLKANPLTEEEQRNLQKASEFNKKHVESLRDFIFNPEEVSSKYYKNHPLDVFSILNQEVHYKARKLPQQEKLLEDLKGNNEFLTKQIEIEKRVEELTNKANPSNIEDYSNDEIIQLENLQEKLEDKISRQQTKVSNLSEQKISDQIQAKNLLIEIFEDTKEKHIQAILSHPSQTKIAPLVLEDNSKFKGSVYKNDSQQRLSFRFSYEGKVINSFPQNIEWIAFFDNFLVFLESSKVSDKKAFISFIDLKYFESAIGRTALPLFYIPLDFEKTNLTKENVLYPQKLSLTDDNKLNIGELSLSLNQISFLSQLQQLSFNVTISLLEPESAKMSQKFLKEIVDNFEHSIADSMQSKNSQDKNLSLDTKQLVLKILENRRQIGTAKDISGNYGKLNQVSTKLSNLPEENQIANEFKDSLMADKNFQSSIENVSNELNKKRKFYNRFFLFLNHISSAQPLGAPKIEKALGLIANSVSLKSDSINNRFLAFKSALSHSLYQASKHRTLTAGVLIGASAIASPEVANYSFTALNTMKNWFLNWGDLFTITAKNSFEWVSATGLYDSYFKGDKPFHLLEGLVALFSAGLIFIGGLHLSTNFYYLKKHLSSHKEQEHQKKAHGLLQSLKNFKNRFIKYEQKNQSKFIQDLSNAEKRKLGLPITIKLGFNDIESHQILKTTSSLASLFSALESGKELSLDISPQGKQSLVLNSSAEKQDILKDNQISLSLKKGNEIIKKTFTLSEGNLKDLLDKEFLKINPELSLTFEMSGEAIHISGLLQNSDFTEAQNERLYDIIKEIKTETGKDLFSSDESLSKTEIKTLNQAIAHLLIGYSSWAKTFRFLGLSWNWFFFVRSTYLRPTTLLKMLYYPKYFNVTHENKHTSSPFNGGTENHIERILNKFKAKKISSNTNNKTEFKNLKIFEEKIIKIEKLFLKEVTAQAYIELTKLTGKEAPVEVSTLSKGAKLQTHDIKNKRLKAFYGVYKRELFQEVMRDYLLDLTNSKENNPNDKKLKLKSMELFISDNSLFEKTLQPEEIRQRVERVAKEQQVTQKSLKAVDDLLSGLLKRRIAKSEETSQKALDPNHNLQMDRFGKAKKLLNDSEALARATRQQLTYYIIDKPIELFFTFLFLAGVDQGILKMLHDKPFTEEAWFHLSRYAIWAGFFSTLITDILAGAWFKVQMDARLEGTQGFDVFPNKREVNKKFGFLKWIKKQFKAEDNSLMENYKYSWKIIIANLPAAFLTYSIIFYLT
ncbi:MAG: hypothetical protein OXC37_00315, partial [Bdellovibrionaceae bacterium]|nr:hypothetical protein [Pseudobdellovibrionaceae bacterium]